MSALVFLDANSITQLPEPEDIERTTLAVAASEMGKDELTTWMKAALDV